jgi:hypothetical protein
MGERAGGAHAKAAKELGLAPGTPVGIGIIDAHAGGLGLLGASIDGVAPSPETLEERVALIGGTSSCHMAVSREPLRPGDLGPLQERHDPRPVAHRRRPERDGRADRSHDPLARARRRAASRGARAAPPSTPSSTSGSTRSQADLPFQALLTRDLHVLPDHHGNRSPRADPSLRGMVSGLKLTDSVQPLGGRSPLSGGGAPPGGAESVAEGTPSSTLRGSHWEDGVRSAEAELRLAERSP